MVDIVLAFAEFWHWPPSVTKAIPISERQTLLEKKLELEDKRNQRAKSQRSRGRR